ncbi:Late embryogenesis abundant protein [Nymphaea thermarum]|nr:Late embryogenesis abundant protein [Nymphaea thermarum]
MARALSNARLFSAVSDLSAMLLGRRNFSAPSSNPVAKVFREGSRKVTKRVETKTAGVSGEKSSWMPDPVTGNFIPEDQFGQTDVAKLRQMLLNQRSGGAGMA